MGFWSFMALGAILLFALEAYRTYVKSKAVRTGDVAKLEARIAALEGKEGEEGLEARVRTLEAIVTDPKTRLDEEIENLRRA